MEGMLGNAVSMTIMEVVRVLNSGNHYHVVKHAIVNLQKKKKKVNC